MDTKEFDKVYTALNPKQKKAVDTIEGPVMVIAGPGTGKTTVLTLRIANILRRTDTPPHGILAITYTDAGVKAMREKLKKVIGNRAHEVHIHTFHGFASAVIAEYQDHFLHLDGLRQISDIEQESLIRSILIEPRYADLRPSGRHDAYLSAIIRTIDDAKRDALTPEAVRDFACKEMERIRSDESSLSTRGATKGRMKAAAEEQVHKCERTLLFADVYASYEERKRESKMMDFNDLIIELLVALQNDELLLRLIQERFLYILVDEHQDTNDAQNFIVSLIAEFFETPNIFIVGDEKQAIYRFQGASVENFLMLEKRWPDVEVISLDTNYRSHQGILDASFAMIEHNYDADEHSNLRIKLSSRSAERQRPVDVVSGENTAAIEEYLVRELQTIIEKAPNATVAIITRRNRELERVLHVLESHGIPVSSERSIDIFTHPIGTVFFDLMEYIADPTRIDALARTMVAGLWGLTLEEAAELIRDMRSGKSPDLEARLPGLVRIRRELLRDGPVGFIIQACRESGFARLAAQDPVYINVWRGIIALSESLVRDRRIVSPAELVEAFLAYRRSSELKTVKVSVGAPDIAIKAMTAHGSKGLEFDYVFLPYATEEAWIGRVRGASFILPQKRMTYSDIRDMRRLFYVALTRARKHATVLSALEETDGKALTPLRFIGELDARNVSSIILPRVDPALPTNGDTDSRAGASAVAITNIAKQRLLTSGLSVTALNHFLESPEKFLIESILRLPQAPSVSAEKGSAMHAALDRVWKSGHKSAKQIASGIQHSVQEYLRESFLPASEKAAVLHELCVAAPAVAAALEAHFLAEGPVFTEYRVESEFEGTFEGESVRIPIHGTLDSIVESGDTVTVFDYKTRKGMSAAAVKGETKSADGKYFRQLVFYHLLLKENPRWKHRQIFTSLVFVSPDKKGRCPILSLPVSDNDIRRVQSEIQSVIDYVWSGKLGALPF